MVQFPQEDRDFNEYIKGLTIDELAIEAQKHLPNSSRRRKALTCLIDKIKRSGKLFYPPKEELPADICDVYPDLKDEALSETWLTICMKIETYNPECAGVMTWVNSYILKYKFRDVVTRYRAGGFKGSPRGKHCFIASLDDLELELPVEETSSDSLSLEQFLEEDPEGLLPREHIRGYPKITWKWLAKEKYIANLTWRQISENIGISVSTISNFFNRRLPPLEPYFRRHFG